MSSNLLKLTELNLQEVARGNLKQAFSPDIKGSQPTSIPDGSPEQLEKVLLKQLGILDGMVHRYSNALDLLLVNGMAAEIPDQVEALGNLVLKCQNQSVRTARAIADIKRPRQTVFIKKQITQQLNQIIDRELPELKRIKETENAPLDIGSEEKAITIDSEMEALGTLDRPKNSRRKRNK